MYVVVEALVKYSQLTAASAENWAVAACCRSMVYIVEQFRLNKNNWSLEDTCQLRRLHPNLQKLARTTGYNFTEEETTKASR